MGGDAVHCTAKVNVCVPLLLVVLSQYQADSIRGLIGEYVYEVVGLLSVRILSAVIGARHWLAR